jgi:photosystem II stability/assembly factor-like uncharacterized protein
MKSVRTVRMARGPVPAALFTVLLWLGGPGEVWAHPNVWTTSGPEGEQHVTALAIDPQKPRILYAGTWGGGVFKSTHQGDRWSAASTGLTSRYVIVLAIDPQTSTTLYAGTALAGVYRSDDGGESWRAINNGLSDDYDVDGVNVTALAIDPRSPETLYAGTGQAFGACCGRVFKSTDGGASWNLASGGLLFSYVVDLAVDPQTPTTLYMVSKGSTSNSNYGVLKSTDGGAMWRAANTGLPQPNFWLRDPPPAVRSLAIDPREPTTLYAGTHDKGVFKSTDGGGTWRPATSGLPSIQGRYPTVPDLAIDPRDPATLYASLSALGPFKSTDGGDSWVAANTGASGLGVGDLVIDPQNPETLYVVGGDHVFRTSDGGSQWSEASKGIIGTWANALAIDPLNPGTVYAGTVELFGYGIVRDRVFKSTDWGGSWSPASRGLTSRDVSTLAIDPQTPTILYAGTGGGLYKSTDGGDSWTWLDWYPGDAGFALPYITSIAVDPRNPIIVYLGTSNHYGVFKSTDGGASWTAVNDGLVDRYGNPPWILDIVIDPQRSSTLYVRTGYATREGVYKSTDGGASWQAANTGLTYWDGSVQRVHRTNTLAIDPQTPTTLYVGAEPHGLPGMEEGGGVFKSTDAGASWSAASGGLDGWRSRLVTALAINPRNPSTLYAGTYDGVYQSTNGGASWTTFNSGLDGLLVVSLALDPRPPGALYAGTQGGGVFVISPAPAPPRVVEADGR